MTEPVAKAQKDSNPSRQSTRSSRKFSTPTVHDATNSRRPRFSIASESRSGGEATIRTQPRHSITSVSPKRPIILSKTPRSASVGTLQATGHKTVAEKPANSAKSQVQPSASKLFSSTIQDLEGILNEALQIARIAADDHEAETSVRSPRLVDMTAPRTADSPGKMDGKSTPVSTDKKATSSLESTLTPHGTFVPVGRNHQYKQDSIKACGPAHDGGLNTKSVAAEPQVSYVLRQDWAQPEIHGRSVPPIEEPGKVAAPDPVLVNLNEPLDHTLRHKASTQALSHRDDKSSRAKRKNPLPILPRSTSRTQRRPHYTREDHCTNLELEETPKNRPEAIMLEKEPSPISDVSTTDRFRDMFGLESSHGCSQAVSKNQQHIDLNGCRHVDVKGSHHFNLYETWRHQSIARDWAISRKRFAATIACMNTSLIGIIIGIYAGEVPAIQYVIADLNHSAILGNVVLYLGLAIPTLLLWPLPLLHGRKPYTIMALAVALCLQIPQGIAVSEFRTPYVSTYRKILLFSRAASGFALGFVNINLQATLLDLFGASLQSRNPHQETVDLYDVRRHGGGMGLWLGVWSWCFIGSISIGFLIGTFIVDNADVTWGFWISLLLTMVVLLLNVIGPEVRRSAFRRTVAEVRGDQGHINRVSRGEIKMHLKSAGPYWWGEEVKAGMELCWKMLQQPGFVVLAVYTGWAYAHFSLVLMVCLLNTFTSQC